MLRILFNFAGMTSVFTVDDCEADKLPRDVRAMASLIVEQHIGTDTGLRVHKDRWGLFSPERVHTIAEVEAWLLVARDRAKRLRIESESKGE